MTPLAIKKSYKKCRHCDIDLFETDIISFGITRFNPAPYQTRVTRHYFCCYECLFIYIEKIIEKEKLENKTDIFDEVGKIFETMTDEDIDQMLSNCPPGIKKIRKV